MGSPSWTWGNLLSLMINLGPTFCKPILIAHIAKSAERESSSGCPFPEEEPAAIGIDECCWLWDEEELNTGGSVPPPVPWTSSPAQLCLNAWRTRRSSTIPIDESSMQLELRAVGTPLPLAMRKNEGFTTLRVPMNCECLNSDSTILVENKADTSAVDFSGAKRSPLKSDELAWNGMLWSVSIWKQAIVSPCLKVWSVVDRLINSTRTPWSVFQMLSFRGIIRTLKIRILSWTEP